MSPPLALLCDYTWAWLRLLGSGHRALLFFVIIFVSAWEDPGEDPREKACNHFLGGI